MIENIYICIGFQDPADEPGLHCKDRETDEKGDDGDNIARSEETLLDHSHISPISQISKTRKVLTGSEG